MNKLRKYKGYLIVIILLCISTLYYNIYKLHAYKVMLNNNCIGVVKNKEQYLKIEDELKRNLNNRFSNIEGKDKLEFKIIIKNKEYSSKNQIKENFLTYSNIKAEAYGVFCDRKYMGFIDHKGEEEKVLKLLKNQFTKELKLKDMEQFKVKNLKLKKCKVPVRFLCKETQEANYTVFQNILQCKDLLKLEFCGTAKEIKSIEPSTIIKSSKDILKGQRKVESQGEKGSKYVYEKIIVKDNKIVRKEEIGEDIIKPCKNKIVLVGSKNPEVVGMAFLEKPSRGTISSGFGRRWGRMHNGIDIAANLGTPIYAACEGNVKFSGVQEGYGNVVIIEHKDGFETRYGHCSKLLVKEGQKVNKGDLIAKVGSTGRSTGPHVHFEVRKNNVPVDPNKYIK